MTPSMYDDDEYDDDYWYADSNPIRVESSSLIIIIAETRSQ
jgi:hypothetical protein